ncbi:MAG: YqgE/AlgH family protein [Rhodospirillales bacterium]
MNGAPDLRYHRIMLVATLRPFAIAVLAALVLAAPAVAAAEDRSPPDDRGSGRFLTGQLLVAAPAMPDPRFARTVIYMVRHDADGAMGLIVNRGFGEGPLAALLDGFGVRHGGVEGTVRLFYGGPVDPGRGFVLHTADYVGASTRIVQSGVAFSSGRDVLEAVAAGSGPRRSLFLLGYAGWGPGQLEGELARDDWLTATAEEALVFGTDPDGAWERALRLSGMPL